MPKTTYILAAMLYSFLSYGQQITFYKNVNYRASTLQQNLNEEGDILLLESETEEISHVEIFNNDYSERIEVNNNQTKIDLKTLPNGNFVIQAKLDKKWIIMSIEKKDDFKIASSNQNTIPIKTESIVALDKTEQLLEEKKPLYYWVVTESNSSFGSNKTMRLEYKDAIAKLISKNKLELKSSIGKGNTLIIYEVYDKSEFMDKQFRNPTYYMSAEASKFLNAKPLYVSNDASETDF